MSKWMSYLLFYLSLLLLSPPSMPHLPISTFLNKSKICILWKKAITHYICFWPCFPLFLGRFCIPVCLHHFLRFIFFLCLAVLIWDSNHSKLFIYSVVCVCDLISTLWNLQRQWVSLTCLVSRYSWRVEAGLEELEACGTHHFDNLVLLLLLLLLLVRKWSES